MTLSRWADNSERGIAEITENMLNFESWYEPEIDPINRENLRFHVEKIFNEDKRLTLNGSEISYNYIKYEYEKVRPGEEDNEMRSSRIYTISGYIIVYTDGTKTQYITNRSGSDFTKTILRKLNNYSKKLEIIPYPFRINEDMFTWMIYKVLNSGEESLEDESHLVLRSIIGFKGSTHDKLAEVKGTGNRIMNLLSTLAFLFENEKVSYINPRVEYENETIEFSMDLNGTIDIDFENYVGTHMFDEHCEMHAKVILISFLEMIPKILTAYHNDINSEEWTTNKKNCFFTSIGEIIQEKIMEKIHS